MRKLLLALYSVLLLSSSAFAADPVLFYSDLVSGPSTGGVNNDGVFVTICGKGFLATQGTSTVTFGATTATITSWSDTKIVAQPNGAGAGATTITVTVDSVASNTLPFVVRAGNIYFCDDSAGGAGTGTLADPWLSPASYYNAMAAGDTCYFRAGTYSGKYGVQGWNYQFTILGSWYDPSGTSNNEIAFVGYPGETAIFVADASGIEGNFQFGDSCNYYVVANLTLKALAGRYCFSGGANHRVINNICQTDDTFTYSAIGGWLTGNKIYGNTIFGHASGNKLHHSIYIGYGCDNVDVGWNYIYGNDTGGGPLVQVHQDDGTETFDNILIHDNIIDGEGTARIITVGDMTDDSDGSIYNNIIIDGASPTWDSWNCLAIVNGSWNVYNNTFYNTYVVGGGYPVKLTSSGTINFKNNIVHTNSTAGAGYFYPGGGGTYNIDSNCYYGDGNGPAADTNAVNDAPDWTDAANGDFTLLSTSPCIDAGADTSSIVTTDIIGTARPDGDAVDIGAYEAYTGEAGVPDPPVPNITTLSLPNGPVNVAYSQTLAATDGTTPYAWTVSAGALPTGLSLAGATGVISGTPTTAGSYTFTLLCTDDAAATDSQEYTIGITNNTHSGGCRANFKGTLR